MEVEIERLVHSAELANQRPVGADLGYARRIDEAGGRYIVFLKKTFPREYTLEGLRIAVDCANGAAYKVAPAVLAELGAEVIPIATEPNGLNINAGCGALYPQNVAQTVREYRADLGIALDGDADRVIMAAEDGSIVDGDRILAMCAIEMQKSGSLSGGAVVATVMSNLGLERALQTHRSRARALRRGRPLRGRDHAPPEPQPGWRAVRTPDLPRPHRHG